MIKADQCKPCLSGKPAALDSIGKPVTVGDKSLTTYEFMQCRDCGRIWTSSEDSGLGGHGGPWLECLFVPG